MAARRVVPLSSDNSGLTCPTDHIAPSENATEYPGLSNRIRGHEAARSSQKRRVLSKDIKAEYRKLARVFGLVLQVGTFDAWLQFGQITTRHLTRQERAALAFGSLISLPQEIAVEAAAAALSAIGDPLPPFLGGMNDARLWAARATNAELRAYALAAFEALPAKDQAAFFYHISEIKVAA